MANEKDGKIQPLDSGAVSLKPAKVETSKSLPESVSMQLLGLMKKVVEDGVNPKTVNAACQCASEIHKILRLNFEMQKKGL
jgi:hypothetical protein